MSTSSETGRTNRRLRLPSTALLRRLTQAGFGLFIVVGSLRHHLSTAEHLASIDAYCPFGGFATLWRWITSGGQFVQKTHGSNLVLALGLIVGVILGGGAFCGWICPLGALQDLLRWISRKLRLPQVRVPDRLHRILGYGRYLVLAGILWATISTARLWFTDYDPYRALFSLDWLFEFDWAHQWRAYLAVIGVLVGGLFIPRLWCRYLCPLGAIVSLLGNFSILRIRRSETACKGCGVCKRPCPVNIDVANADPVISSNCIGCLECLEVCPWDEALRVELGPPLPRLPRARTEESVA
jgi:polyferredoxin